MDDSDQDARPGAVRMAEHDIAVAQPEPLRHLTHRAQPRPAELAA